jgi:hypothetical protein
MFWRRGGGAEKFTPDTMKREILTYPISAAELKAELAFFAEHFRSLGYAHCEALFGWAWGNKYYTTTTWDRVYIPLTDLLSEVQRVESAGLGLLGRDDLFLSVPPLNLEFQFCNDSDIHVFFEGPAEIPEFFYNRWKVCGFHPAKWTTNDAGQRVRLRID